MDRVCTKCKLEKPEEEFRKNGARKDGTHPWCKECTNQSSKDYHYKANRRITRHGISVEQFNDLWEAQDGCCAHCLKPLLEHWCIDHNRDCCKDRYSCGKCIRGIVCRTCNGDVEGLDRIVKSVGLKWSLEYRGRGKP